MPVAPPPQIGEISRVVIVGSGTMGQQIGFQCAGHGFDVVLYDNSPAALDSARERIEAYADGLVGRRDDHRGGPRRRAGADHDDHGPVRGGGRR
jgi:3-hydroxyacyl-CoA dehydrogenase